MMFLPITSLKAPWQVALRMCESRHARVHLRIPNCPQRAWLPRNGSFVLSFFLSFFLFLFCSPRHVYKYQLTLMTENTRRSMKMKYGQTLCIATTESLLRNDTLNVEAAYYRTRFAFHNLFILYYLFSKVKA